jgi:hypothetical protein
LDRNMRKTMKDHLLQIVECQKCLKLGVYFRNERRENLKLAYSYKPDSVDILWIVESPPKSDPPRYFYRPELTGQDSLFREVMKSLGIRITDPKAGSLEEFKGKGHFLIDAAKCPVDKDNSHLKPEMLKNCSRLLRDEVKAINPQKILIIKKNIYGSVFRTIQEIGFQDKVLNIVPIPFPGSGRQKEFRDAVSKYLGSFSEQGNLPDKSFSTPHHSDRVAQDGDQDSKSLIINNITDKDVTKGQIRITVANKPFFPEEIMGKPMTHPMTFIYEGGEYPASYKIGSKDGKSRSGVLKLTPDLYNGKLSIEPGVIWVITLLSEGVYSIRKQVNHIV